jgi:glycosyltransferase involved in cell wall biosynthesis
MLDPWFNRTYPLKRLKKMLYWPWGEYRVLRDASAVLFTSEEERRLAGKSFWPYRCREIVVNYGTAGPDVDLETARDEFLVKFPALRKKRLLVFLGRLHEKKGCDLLIKAFTAMPNREWHLVMAGPGADETYLAQLRQLAGRDQDRITFTGMLTGNLKWGALRAAEAFVLPSHQENFGLAVAEALACGTPVLISNKINIWREIVNDEAGFADEDDLEGTKRLLARWVSAGEEERGAMRQKARQCFAQRFEIDQATDSLLQALGNVCSAP